MKLKFIVVVSAAVLLAFAVHDVVSVGMGIFTSASRAPEQFRDALGDIVACGIQYKELATAVCLFALFIPWNPTLKSR